MNVVIVDESPPITAYRGHTHEEFELVFVSKGRMTLRLGEKDCSVSENDLLVLPPNTYHEGVEGEGFVNVYLHARNLSFSEVVYVHDYDGSVRTLLYLLMRTMHEKELLHAEISDKLLEALCEYVKKYSRHTYKYDFVLEIKRLIYDNLSNASFSISSEIRRIGFNTDYFRRCFFAEMGETPLAYMTRLRVERAKALLTQKSFVGIETVAEQCGFSDSFYFSKLFKKHVGISPSVYRKNNT